MIQIRPSVCYREGPLTQEDYAEAIEDLQAALQQPGQDHLGCTICEDSGHTAGTCRHNPLLLARAFAKAEGVWTCFWCGVVFTTEADAAAHFGDNSDQEPACKKEAAAMTERQSFIIELALWLDFKMVNDDGDLFHCTQAQLIEFAERIERAVTERVGKVAE